MPNRQKKRRQARKIFTLGVLSLFSLFILSLGMGLLLMKSPQAKSDFYLAMAQQYQQEASADHVQVDAYDYLLQISQKMMDRAIQQTPYDANLWKTMALTMAKRENFEDALRARNVASSLGAVDLPDLAVIPTFKREKSLALSDSLQTHTIMR